MSAELSPVALIERKKRGGALAADEQRRSAIAEFDTNPDQLAHALRTYLGADGVVTLMAQLRSITG